MKAKSKANLNCKLIDRIYNKFTLTDHFYDKFRIKNVFCELLLSEKGLKHFLQVLKTAGNIEKEPIELCVIDM